MGLMEAMVICVTCLIVFDSKRARFSILLVFLGGSVMSKWRWRGRGQRPGAGGMGWCGMIDLLYQDGLVFDNANGEGIRVLAVVWLLLMQP